MKDEKLIHGRIVMEDGGEMPFVLYANKAPNTVKNFVWLSRQGFYDGLIFHRVIEGFMIQGGDPTGTGTGGPGYTIKGEFENNRFPNPMMHERGTLSMARAMHPDSAGSQFFVMHANAPHLDGDYAAFGRLVGGLDVLDRIATCRTQRGDRPVEDQKIATIVIDPFDGEVEEPERMKRA